ncbi:O-antigen ligase family protein [Flavitalea flava]
MKSLLLLDLTGRVFEKKEKILYWLISVFFLSLFLPDMPVINNILIGATVMHSCFYNSLVEKRQLLRQRKEIMLMIVFYLLHLLSALFSQNRQEALSMLALRAPLLIFPLCIGLLYIRSELKDRILLSYCFFTTLAATACMGFAIGQYLKFQDNASLYGEGLTRLTGQQSVYIAMAVNLALFTYVYLLFKKSFAIQYKGLVFLSIAFLVVFHYMLASRIAIITLYSGFLILIIWHYARVRKFLGGGVLVIGLLAGVVLMMIFFPKTVDRFKELKHANYKSQTAENPFHLPLTADQWNETGIRMVVWSSGWELAKQHWIFGVPLGDKQEKLTEVYRERNFNYGVQSRRNMHNTYLDVLCNFGVIGLMIFLLGYLIIPLMACYRMKDGLGLFIIVAFAVAMITETWPDRSVGCVMLGFFLSLVSAWKIRSAPGER